MMFILAWGVVLFVVYLRRRLVEKGMRIEQLETEKKLVSFMAASEAEERERETIARNLHDEISVKLTVYKQAMEKHAMAFERGAFVLAEYNKDIAIVDALRTSIVNCAADLIPSYLLKYGLEVALEHQLIQISNAGKVHAKLNDAVELKPVTLSKSQTTQVYRICLELINNILKYASPQNLELGMGEKAGEFNVRIWHDGERISNDEIARLQSQSSGLGLQSLEARRLMLRGKIDYSTAPDVPAIVISFPLVPAAIQI